MTQTTRRNHSGREYAETDLRSIVVKVDGGDLKPQCFDKPSDCESQIFEGKGEIGITLKISKSKWW